MEDPQILDGTVKNSAARWAGAPDLYTPGVKVNVFRVKRLVDPSIVRKRRNSLLLY